LKALEDIVHEPKMKIRNEVLTGSTIIRCYEKTETYALKAFDLLDQDGTFELYNYSLWNYICSKNAFLGNVITFSGYILAFMCKG